MASLAAAAEERTREVSASSATNKTSAVLQIAASLLWLPQAALISIAIGNIADARASDQIGWLAVGVLGVGILRAVLDAIGSRAAFRAARGAVTSARQRAVGALAIRSPLDASRPASGRAASVIAEQSETIVPYLARFEIAKIRAIVVPAVFFLFVLCLSWAAAIVLLVSAPLIPIFMALIGWRAKQASEAQLVEAGSMNAFLLDRLRGMTTIRSLDAVDVTARRLRANAESLRERTMAVLRIAFLSSAVLELFSALGVAMVAVYVGFHLLGQLRFGTWGGPLNLSEGLFILLLAPAFFEPLRELSSVWHDRAAGQAALHELNSLAADGSRLLGGNDALQARYPAVSAPAVLAENLSFRHAGSGTSVLDSFRLSMAPGEHLALLGPSGSGKSTLLALLAGLASPASGVISIGGRPLSEESAADLRRGIAWIGQRPHVFAGTLASNATLGGMIDRERVAKALRFASLDEIARARGSDAIGENGIGLSGGEALRLALARVAIDPDVTLVLADEPTAHLDAHTAEEITDNLLSLARGKTLIVATHDLTLAARMDRIIRFGDLPLENAA
jgi:ATP-binding cassette, subfamily C, bacterial CydD